MPHYLRPSADTAEAAILPSDPGKALLLAQHLISEPRMSNHARGLWGYYGLTAAGVPLTVQSTGIGGPSAAIVLTELAGLGVQRAVRVGSCAALTPGLEAGNTLVVEHALAGDGASRALGAGAEALPDEPLTAALAAAAKRSRRAIVASSDLVHTEDERLERWARGGAVALDLEAAALFAAGARLGVALAAVLVLADPAPGAQPPALTDESLENAYKSLGEAAALALGVL